MSHDGDLFSFHSGSQVLVQELDWLQPDQVANLSPPYDLLLATDCEWERKDKCDELSRSVRGPTAGMHS